MEKRMWEPITVIPISLLVLALVLWGLLHNWNRLTRHWKKHQTAKFLINVVFPAVIPFIITVGMAMIEGDNSFSQWIKEPTGIFLSVMCVVTFVLTYFQFKEWRKDCRDRKIEWVNRIYREAYDKLYDVFKSRCTAYKTTALHSGHGILPQKIEYDIFDHIREICSAYRVAIAKIANIPTTHINVSFIYRYNYPGANHKDAAWRWIIGKGSTLCISLSEFIKRTDTLFYYLINNSVDGVFYNDKRDAQRDGRYFNSSKDMLHNCEGSVMASKVIFSSNASQCSEGILIITTYGEKFVRDDAEHTPEEFQRIIEHDIFPCYRNLLKMELGMLYFRHKTEVIHKKSRRSKKKK